ncbi:ribonuclease HII [bacterium]|nr:ribonuclease HII [bacterium]
MEEAGQLFYFDKSLNRAIIGTDEAGRGPGAGGVFAAAVHFEAISDALIKDLAILNDSKKLTEKKRESIYEIIKNNTFNKIVCVEVEEIERINILNASLKAMKQACNAVYLSVSENNPLTLVDGNKLIKDYIYPQEYLIKGDAKSASIAAASILAKVTRDRYMKKLHEEYPMYGWDKNAGYLTKKHLEAIDKYGTTPYHRLSFLKKHFDKAKLEM